MKRALVLVEGQTEERFVKDVVAPELLEQGLFVTPTILTTKTVKNGPNFKGGVSSYAKMRRDLTRLLGDSTALVTTLIDYYGLPSDTPGLDSRPTGSGLARVEHVEQAIATDLSSPQNFVPFLTLHEFEALLFTDPEQTASVILAPERTPNLISAGQGLLPEEINDDPSTAPSKRISGVFPEFRKVLHGATAARRIGLSAIRAKCPHFNSWLLQIENFAKS